MLERLQELRGNLGALELFKLSLRTTLDKLDPLRKKQKVISSKPDLSLFAQKLKDDCLVFDRNLSLTSPRPSQHLCGLHNRTKGVQMEAAYFGAALTAVSEKGRS